MISNKQASNTSVLHHYTVIFKPDRVLRVLRLLSQIELSVYNSLLILYIKKFAINTFSKCRSQLSLHHLDLPGWRIHITIFNILQFTRACVFLVYRTRGPCFRVPSVCKNDFILSFLWCLPVLLNLLLLNSVSNVSAAMASTSRPSFCSYTICLSVCLPACLCPLHCLAAFLITRNITCSPKQITFCYIFPHLLPFCSYSNHSS